MSAPVKSKSKRCFDLIATTSGIIIISPFLLIIALAVKLSSRGPIIFQQTRSGLDCKPFTAYKFRTMVEGAERMGLGYEVAKNDSRITKVGKFLRDTSLDELPQLFNTLKDRTASYHSFRDSEIYRETENASTGKTWDIWLGSGKWTEFIELGRKN